MSVVRSLIGKSFGVSLGAAVSAAGINLLLAPHNLLPAGGAGVSMLLGLVIPLPVGVLYALLNVPLFAMAWRHVDRTFALLSLVGGATFSLSLVATVPLANLQLVHDPLLASIFGGAIAGGGGGFALRVHGSLGGMDIVGVLLRKRLSVSVAGAALAVNVAIVAVQAAVSGLELALLTMLSLAAGATMFDRVQTGLNRSKAVLVVSDDAQKVGDAMLERLNRGVTYLEGLGGFRKVHKRLVYCVVTQRQLARLKRVVAEVDPNAFVTVLDATEVIGMGFVREPGA